MTLKHCGKCTVVNSNRRRSHCFHCNKPFMDMTQQSSIFLSNFPWNLAQIVASHNRSCTGSRSHGNRRSAVHTEAGRLAAATSDW